MLQLTPAFVLSLLTTAEMFDFAPVASEAGGAVPKEIAVVGGGGVEPPPPHAARVMATSEENNGAR
jgi:hypothetical protein